MTSLSAHDVVDATGIKILLIGTTWMLDPGTAAFGGEIGLPGRSFWAVGRGGVLGAVDADVVVAAFGFVNPETLVPLWNSRPAGQDPHEAARYYAHAAGAWAARTWSKVPEADLVEMASLAETVAAAAWPAVGALFAGWRALPVPGLDAAGRAALALHVLREHRGGAHITGVMAMGMSPVAAIMHAPAGRGGAERAERFGWVGPYEEADELAAAREQAEAITDRVAAAAYEVLSAPQRARFVELVDQLHETATRR
ncbi:MAG: hypothetical protein AB7O92_00135 [Acidimicrobiia bacterium]